MTDTNKSAEALTTCNCRWNGDRLVQQCTLHEAWKDAIHEWAERAKTAERKLETLTATEQAVPDEEGLTAAYLSGFHAGKAAPTVQAQLLSVLQRIVDCDDAGCALTESHVYDARQAIAAAQKEST